MIHYNITYKVEQDRNNFEVPVPLPNNLKKIKKILKLTDRELSVKLDCVEGYIRLLVNCKQDFSGKGIIKALKELDITFSTLYDINDTVTAEVEKIRDYIIIIKTEEKIDTEETLIEVLVDLIKNKLKLNPDKENIKVKSINLKSENERYNTDNLKNLKDVPCSVSDWYCKEVKKLTPQGENEYLIGIQQFRKEEKQIIIKTQEHLDKETSMFLDKAPFYKPLMEDVQVNDIKKIDGTTLILNKKVKAITADGAVETDKFTSNDYVFLNKKYYIFRYDANTYLNNKLRLYRFKKGYSLEFMAEILGVLPESYRLLEVGYNRLSAKQMWIIENELGIVLESIYDIPNIDKDDNEN